MSRLLKDLLVISDMDGTLLCDNKHLLPSTVETIRLFVTLGGKFTVATGRTAESVSRYTELLDIIEPAITSGGTVVYDFKCNEVKLSETLPKMVAHQVMHDMMAAFPHVGILAASAENSKYYQAKPSTEAQDLIWVENMSFFVRDVDDLPLSWNKMLFAGPPVVMEDVLQYLNERNYPGVSFVATAKQFVEMMPEGVSKGSALLHLCKMLGVKPENTIAFGDYYNDIESLKTAGTAVAMSNAPQEVKMIADHVTGSCNDGAVGQYLYKLIKEYEKE